MSTASVGFYVFREITWNAASQADPADLRDVPVDQGHGKAGFPEEALRRVDARPGQRVFAFSTFFANRTNRRAQAGPLLIRLILFYHIFRRL